jgi:hypothetical protein
MEEPRCHLRTDHPRRGTRLTTHDFLTAQLRDDGQCFHSFSMDISPPSAPGSSSPSSGPGYAFLNHSTSSLTHNLPPSVDDKPLARQKRKRTRCVP